VYPHFGICLGHQILGLAMGASTFKLKFGHRGANHPVKELRTGQIEITSQNHGFAVDPGSLPSDVEVTHTNLYDEHDRGTAPQVPAGLLRAVPSGGRARAARRGLSVTQFLASMDARR
jgi:carbamoylphosphate synthase small subunit